MAFVSDALIIVTSVALASGLVHPDVPVIELLRTHSILCFAVLVAPLSVLVSRGVYRRISNLSWKLQSSLALQAYACGIAVMLCISLITTEITHQISCCIAFSLLCPLLYTVVWSALRRRMRRLRSLGYGRWKTLVLDSGMEGTTGHPRFHELPDWGYDVVEVIQANGSVEQVESGPSRDDIKRAINNKAIEHIVVGSSRLNGWFSQLEELCRSSQVGMSVVSPDVDLLLTSTRIDDRSCLSLSFHDPKPVEVSRQRIKRVFDFLGALFLLIVFSPLFLVIAIATKLESPGPVFFKQKRSLSDIYPSFECYKFRSMDVNADRDKEKLRHLNESNGALFKMKKDPRLTKVGRFIRKYSLDELPQLINVLKGEMSLVGPRPLPVSDFSYLKYEEHDTSNYFRYRAKAKPGMTGLWQISGRSTLGFREMVLLDLYYIDNRSLLFDLEILLQTIPVVVFRRGAY